MTDELVKAEGLYRYYGPHCAVAKLDLSLHRGEVLGLLGPNGAGKSSTLQMLTGNLAPSAGRIRINGEDLLDEPRKAKRHIGYLPEQPPVYRDLTVREYLRYCARLHAVPRREVQAAVDQACARCGLDTVSGRLIGHLSKGYQQRVGIAQAIIHRPAVIVLDEPTVGLDPLQIQEIRRLIRELATEHGVILSTHILPEVQSVCSRVQIVHHGRTVFSALLSELDQNASGAVLARFANPPSVEVLQQLEGVREVEVLADGHIRLVPHAKMALAEGIAEQAVAHGWRLQELLTEQANLERIFTDVVYHERNAATAPEATKENTSS